MRAIRAKIMNLLDILDKWKKLYLILLNVNYSSYDYLVSTLALLLIVLI